MNVDEVNPGQIEQLSLGLAIDDIADEAEIKKISFDEAMLISDNARRVFEDSSTLTWSPDYWRLRNQGWPWRVAAYIAWAASPKQERQPKNQQEFATSMLGLTSDRVIATWRKKNPAIDEVIALLQVAPLFEHRRDIYDALIKSATSPDYKSHPDRKLALEMLGDYIPRAKVDLRRKVDKDDLSDMSDAELAELARKLGVSGIGFDDQGDNALSSPSQGRDEPWGDDVE